MPIIGKARPNSNPRKGHVVDHIGFSFDNLADSLGDDAKERRESD